MLKFNIIIIKKDWKTMSLEERLQEEDVINLPDWRVAEILNTPDPNLVVQGKIPIWEIIYRLQKWGVWGELQYQAYRGNDPPAKLCVSVLSALEPGKTPMANVDMSDSNSATMFQIMGNSLISGGFLTYEQFSELLELRMVHISWSELNLGRHVTSREIGISRGGI